jgi:hypothetical protein
MSIVEWRDSAYSRLSRSIRWGDSLLARLRRSDSPAKGLVLEIQDWHESSAFFVNFLLDGNAASQLKTLGYDPRLQDSVELLHRQLPSQIQRKLAMRITLLKKWFHQIMDQISTLELLHKQILTTLLEVKDHRTDRFHLQMRLKLEDPPLLEALAYLRRQNLLEYDEREEVVRLTAFGATQAGILARSDQMAKKHRGPNDLIFFSYASEDRDRVMSIHAYVDELGYNTWIDRINLVGGQDWDLEISTAIEQAAIGLVFLSNKSVEKTGYVNKEIKRILDKMDMMPEGKVFMIPIRLDDCPIPRRLSKWQVLDATNEKFEEQFVAAIRHAL